MSEWEKKTLGDFLTLKRGYDLPERLREEGRVPIYSSSGISGFHSKSKVNPPGVVTGRYGTIGSVFLCSEPFWPLNTTLYVQDFKGSDEIFVYYFLQKFNWNQFNDKSAVPGINRNDLHAEPILVPSVDEQKQIAAVLSSLDRKIENLRRQNKTLERIAQTLFKHWFVDFEFPNADGKPYKSFGGAMVRSELGEIPVGWRIGTLEDIVDIFTGYPFKSDLYSFESGIRVVRGENVSLGFLRWDMEKRWGHDLESYSDYFLQKDDYVIGMDGSRVGRNRSIILSSDLPLILAQRVARLRAKNPIFAGYINTSLNQDRFEKYVDFVKTGTSIPHISSTQIKDFECLIPTQEVVSAFEKLYQSWVKKVSLHFGQIQTLTKTRDVLLPQLMSGKLRIKT